MAVNKTAGVTKVKLGSSTKKAAALKKAAPKKAAALKKAAPKEGQDREALRLSRRRPPRRPLVPS